MVIVHRDTLSKYALGDGDVIQLLPSEALQGQQGQGAGASSGNQDRGLQMELNHDGSAKNPAKLMEQIRGNAHLLSSLRQNNPDLAK
jgi:hypothetical protein